MLKRVLRPQWPKVAFWRIVALTICGLGLLGLSIRDLLVLQVKGAEMTPTGITDILARGLLLAALGVMLLVSALWAILIRCYGLLVRKLARKDGT